MLAQLARTIQLQYLKVVAHYDEDEIEPIPCSVRPSTALMHTAFSMHEDAKHELSILCRSILSTPQKDTTKNKTIFDQDDTFQGLVMK